MTWNTSPQKGKEVVILSPGNRIVEVNGRLFYNEGAQSWNTIRLRKEVLHEFPDLKEKSSSFGYKMIIPKSKESFKEIIGELEEAIPILLFFNKDIKQT